MKRLKVLLLALLALTFLGCNPNDDSTSTENDPFTQNFGTSVSRDFIGQVVNESNQPLKGVTVKIGSKTAQTDFNGVFIINNAGVYEQFAYITAKKSGYIDGSRAMVPTTGKNNVKIMMISNVHVEGVPSGEVSEVILTNGTKVKFDGAFQDENGNPYSGSVRVSMYHLESSNENITNLMPGMLYAKDQNGGEKVLETYGMLKVELKGDNEQKLQIAAGHTAEITMAIDDTQLASAPSSIPLWHFDEAKGYWIEEGSAARVGNNYVGNVSHFSWWNCDAQFPTVTLSVNVTDVNGLPLSGIQVHIARTDNNGTSGRTDSMGWISGLVPANEMLTVTISDVLLSCTVYTSTVGPFGSDTVLPTIVLNSSANISTTQVSGNLKKCDNSNVTNGYVLVKKNDGNQIFSVVTNGTFNFTTTYCNDATDFTLKGFDFDATMATTVTGHNFISPITNVGTLTACTAMTEFISYQIDNGPTKYLYENLRGGDMAPEGLQTDLSIYGDNGSGGIGLSIFGNNNTPGIYTTSSGGYIINGTEIGYISSGITNTVTFNLTQFGAFGEYIDMTFSGTYTNQTGTHSITGTVHVIRNDIH
nr:carboxypeptidase-like regulatory domain-containing protein [uncultured Flavobacterium sp.]